MSAARMSAVLDFDVAARIAAALDEKRRLVTLLDDLAAALAAPLDPATYERARAVELALIEYPDDGPITGAWDALWLYWNALAAGGKPCSRSTPAGTTCGLPVAAWRDACFCCDPPTTEDAMRAGLPAPTPTRTLDAVRRHVATAAEALAEVSRNIAQADASATDAERAELLSTLHALGSVVALTSARLGAGTGAAAVCVAPPARVRS